MTKDEVGEVMKNTFHLIAMLERYDGSHDSRMKIEIACIPLRHVHGDFVTTWELFTTTNWILDRIENGTYSAGDLVADLRDNLRTMLDPDYDVLGEVLENMDIKSIMDSILGETDD